MSRATAKTKAKTLAASPKPSAKAPRLNVKVFSPYQLFYQGEAASVSAINKTGPFDVLYDHANFFSLLIGGDVVVQTGFAKLAFPIGRGVIKVANNQVTVFVGV